MSRFLTAFVACAALLLASCGPGSNQYPPPGEARSPAATQPTAGDRDQRDAVGTIAAVLGDGRLVVLDSDGHVAQTLMTDVNVEDRVENYVELAPSGDDIYVVRPASRGRATPEIVRVSISDGNEEVVTQGEAPAVSPDGETLAYVDIERAEPPVAAIVLRDLASGQERRLVRAQQSQFHYINELAWTANGDQLAMQVGEIATAIYVVSANAEDLDEVRQLGPASESQGSWDAIAAYREGQLAIVETCCDLVNRERWRVIAVDVGTGAVEGKLLPRDRVEAYALDGDISGTGLLVLTDYGPGGGKLWRWSSAGGSKERSEGGRFREIRDGVIAAAW